MIELDIPGRGILKIDYIVFDVNGTLAVDGSLIAGVFESISRIKKFAEVFLLTANSHGKQKQIDAELGITATILNKGDEINQKRVFVERLSSDKVVAIGQGSNDFEMLKTAAIGICVLSPEGTAIETMLAADILVPDISKAFELLENPTRMIATLRK